MVRLTQSLTRIAIALVVELLGCRGRDSECADSESACSSSDDPFVPTTRVASPRHPSDQELRLEVEYGHCFLLTALPGREMECVYQPGSKLRLWVSHPRASEASVAIDGREHPVEFYPVTDEPGLGFRVELASSDAHTLALLVPDESPWTLALRSTTELTTTEQEELARIEERGIELEMRVRSGDLTAVPEVRAQVARLWSQGWLSKAVHEALIASYHLSQQPGRPELGREVIDDLPSMTSRHPRESAAISIYRGGVAWAQGQLVEAASAYRDGARYAVRVEDAGLQLDSLPMYARVLAELGYFEAAAFWAATALPIAREHGRPADQVGVLTTIGWANLRLREGGHAHEDPGRWFREALEFFPLQQASVDVGELDPARLGLASLAILDGQPAVALSWIEQIDHGHLTSTQRVTAIDIRLQALLNTPTAEVAEIRASLIELEDAAERAASPWARWRAAVRRGIVLEHEGNLDGARSSYERSEELLDPLIPMSFLGLGGEGDGTSREEGTERLVALLAKTGRVDDALCVARRAQARMARLAVLLRRLDRRARAELQPRIESYLATKRAYHASVERHAELPLDQRGRLAGQLVRQRRTLDEIALEILATPGEPADRPGCEELRGREPGELLLGLYPHRGGLIVFAQDDEDTTFRVVSDHGALSGSASESWLGPLLLGPLDERLRRARQVRVLSAGYAARIHVHSLTWKQQPLGLQLPVVYGLELPSPAGSVQGTATPSALVLADSRTGGARREVEWVVETLSRSGWAVRTAAAAPRPLTVWRAELAKAGHFHYAGHAYYEHGRQYSPNDPIVGGKPVLSVWPPYPGGAASRPSYIPLGESGWFGVEDVLMMESVPRTVVLNGCSTGVHDERTAYGGISLATAFVGAGAAAVVASTQEVHDQEAALVGRGLYSGTTGQTMAEPGTWLMHALRWARDHGAGDRVVEHYRVFVP